MKGKLEYFWDKYIKPHLFKKIGTGIVALFAAFYHSYLKIFILWLWGYAVRDYEVHGLFMLVLYILSLLFIIVSIKRLTRKWFLKPWLDYNEDIFDGIKWRWVYNQYCGKIAMDNVRPFCPVDDYELDFNVKFDD